MAVLVAEAAAAAVQAGDGRKVGAFERFKCLRVLLFTSCSSSRVGFIKNLPVAISKCLHVHTIILYNIGDLFILQLVNEMTKKGKV